MGNSTNFSKKVFKILDRIILVNKQSFKNTNKKFKKLNNRQKKKSKSKLKDESQISKDSLMISLDHGSRNNLSQSVFAEIITNEVTENLFSECDRNLNEINQRLKIHRSNIDNLTNESKTINIESNNTLNKQYKELQEIEQILNNENKQKYHSLNNISYPQENEQYLEKCFISRKINSEILKIQQNHDDLSSQIDQDVSKLYKKFMDLKTNSDSMIQEKVNDSIKNLSQFENSSIYPQNIQENKVTEVKEVSITVNKIQVQEIQNEASLIAFKDGSKLGLVVTHSGKIFSIEEGNVEVIDHLLVGKIQMTDIIYFGPLDCYLITESSSGALISVIKTGGDQLNEEAPYWKVETVQDSLKLSSLIGSVFALSTNRDIFALNLQRKISIHTPATHSDFNKCFSLKIEMQNAQDEIVQINFLDDFHLIILLKLGSIKVLNLKKQSVNSEFKLDLRKGQISRFLTLSNDKTIFGVSITQNNKNNSLSSDKLLIFSLKKTPFRKEPIKIDSPKSKGIIHSDQTVIYSYQITEISHNAMKSNLKKRNQSSIESTDLMINQDIEKIGEFGHIKLIDDPHGQCLLCTIEKDLISVYILKKDTNIKTDDEEFYELKKVFFSENNTPGSLISKVIKLQNQLYVMNQSGIIFEYIVNVMY